MSHDQIKKNHSVSPVPRKLLIQVGHKTPIDASCFGNTLRVRLPPIMQKVIVINLEFIAMLRFLGNWTLYFLSSSTLLRLLKQDLNGRLILSSETLPSK